MNNVCLSQRNRLRNIIDESTKYNVVIISHEIVTEFKSLLRGDNIMIEFCFQELFDKLSNKHAQTRLLSLMLINLIFKRSKHFRELTIHNLEFFFELTLPINSQKPLPSPPKTAIYLTQQSIEFIEEWVQDFGSFYFRLKLGYNHLIKVHYIHFPNKRLHEKEQQKLKQINHIKRLKEKLQRFIELTSKFKQKYPKILTFLNEFELKIQTITPTFDSMLQQKLSTNNDHIVGFSDDDSDEDDMNLTLPTLPVTNNGNTQLEGDNFLENFDFMSSYQRYGLHKGYSLQITIDTDLNNYLKNNNKKDKIIIKNDYKRLLKHIGMYRYLTEMKLQNQIEEWRSILINADLNVITNKDKQLILGNQRIDILKKLDDIHSKINSLVSKCNTLKIKGENSKKNDKINRNKKERIIVTRYVDVKASLVFENDEMEKWKQQEIMKRKMLTQKKNSSVVQQQRKRILFKKLVSKKKRIKGVKFGFKLNDK